MINTLFSHIKKHKWVYGVGAFALVTILVVVSLQSSGFKYSSKLSGNIQWAGARITEEQFGQEVGKILEEQIESMGQEKWGKMSDDERGGTIDAIIQRLKAKYNLSEMEGVRRAAGGDEMNPEEKMRMEEEMRRDGGGMGEREQPEEGAEKSLNKESSKLLSTSGNLTAKIEDDSKTVAGRLPKLVDPGNLKLVPPTPVKQGTVNVSTNLNNGSYNIYDGTTVVGGGNGMVINIYNLPAGAKTGKSYKIVFDEIKGYTKPADILFNLKTGDNKTYVGKYVKVAAQQGTVNIYTNHKDGSYKIYKCVNKTCSTTVLASGKGLAGSQHTLPASKKGEVYQVIYGKVAGHKIPTHYEFSLIANTNHSHIGKYEILPSTVSKGTLSASSNSGSIESAVITSGTKDLLTSQYTFYATNEAFTIKTLTIANSILGDFSKLQDVNILDTVRIRYPNENKIVQTVEGSLVSGGYTFKNLDFYVPKDKNTTMEIFADFKAITSGTYTLSGKKIRLGLKEQNSKLHFEAVGESSNQSVYLDKAGDIKNSQNVPTFITRKSKPVFSKVWTSSLMQNTNDVYKFRVTADGGDVSLARLEFNVSTTGSIVDIYGWDFRNSSGSVNGTNIWGIGALQSNNTAVYLKNTTMGSGLQDANITSTSLVNDGQYRVIVTFNNEETISKGSTETYTLRASVNGATTDDRIEVNLSSSDETGELAADTNYDNDNGFNNTTHIIGSANIPMDSIFKGSVGPGDDDNEFFGDTVADWSYSRSIIWSDRSGGDFAAGNAGTTASAVHTYPTVNGGSVVGTGTVTDYSGTLDWTNGYNLNIDELSATALKK